MRLLQYYTEPQGADGIQSQKWYMGMINVVYAEKYLRPDFNQMINTPFRLLDRINITFDCRSRIFLDVIALHLSSP
jgi:hypothetical protein